MAGPLNTLPDIVHQSSSPSSSAPSPSSSSAQPPRPANSWILYRAWKMKNLPPTAPGESRRNQGSVSSLVSELWKNETPTVRSYFERLAEETKIAHKAKHPNYKYQPQKRDKTKPKTKPKAAPKPKQEARSSRSVSRESEPSPPSAPRPGHPYALAYRPQHVPCDRFGPSPPMYAAASPSPPCSPLPLPLPLPLLPPLPLPLSLPSSSLLPSEALPFPLSLPSSSLLPSEALPLPPSNPHQMTEPENDTLSQDIPSIDYAQPLIDVIPEWPFVDQGMPSSAQTWDLSTSTDTNALYFQVPPAQHADWPSTNFSCGHLPHEHTFNCILSDIPPATSPERQPEEIEISVGAVPSGSRSYHFQDFFNEDVAFDFDSNLFQADNAQFDDALLAFGSEYSHTANVDGSETFNPDIPQASVEGIPYVPPSGAAHSSTRRVAGNWTQYLQDLDNVQVSV